MASQDENAIKPCPECHTKVGYEPVGEHRCRCLNCDALLKNEEVIEDYQEKLL